MEKFLFLVLMLMLISRLFHAGSHTIILMLINAYAYAYAYAYAFAYRTSGNQALELHSPLSSPYLPGIGANLGTKLDVLSYEKKLSI